MRSDALIALLLAIGASGCGVRGVDQKADTELGEYTAANAAELGAGEKKSAELEVGVDESGRVPMKLEWEVVKDAAGCLRIKRASLRRTGGPTGFELYDVKFTLGNDGRCSTRLDFKQEFETVYLRYCWRWNGAGNTAKCAYDGAVTLSADEVGVESFNLKGRASASASAR